MNSRQCTLVLLIVLHTGCAGSGGPAPAEPLGAGLGVATTLAHVEHHEEGPFRVEVEKVVLLQVTDRAWIPIDPGDVGDEPIEGELALFAQRNCKGRIELDFYEEEASSWFHFVEGGLVAYDHTTFRDRCGTQNHLLPGAEGERKTERALRRYHDQRYPPSPITLEDRFTRGHAYLAAGRLEDARRQLGIADRTLDRRRTRHNAREGAREDEAFLEWERSMLRERAQLSVAVEKERLAREGPPEDPNERFFRGLE